MHRKINKQRTAKVITKYHDNSIKNKKIKKILKNRIEKIKQEKKLKVPKKSQALI